MTKTGRGRHTWVSDQIVDKMLNLLDESDGKLLFTKQPIPSKAVGNMSDWFDKMRAKLGKKNPKWLERYDGVKGEHKYKIYSLRAKFISDCMAVDSSGNSGHYWAGHEKYMGMYEREEQSLQKFNLAEEFLRDDRTTIPEGIETEVSELRQNNMKLEDELYLAREQHKAEIQKIHDEAERQRQEDFIEMQIKFAESQGFSKSKKKSKK